MDNRNVGMYVDTVRVFESVEDPVNWNSAAELTDNVVHQPSLEGQTQNQLMLPISEPWSPRVKCTTDLWSVMLWGPLMTTPSAIHQSASQWLGSGPNRAVCQCLKGSATVLNDWVSHLNFCACMYSSCFSTEAFITHHLSASIICQCAAAMAAIAGAGESRATPTLQWFLYY